MRPVEHHTGGNAVVVVVRQPSGGRGDLGVRRFGWLRYPLPPSMLGRRCLLLGAGLREPIEIVEVASRAVRPQVLDEAGPDMGVVGNDDDRPRPFVAAGQGRTIGIRSQPRTVDVGASLMPS